MSGVQIIDVLATTGAGNYPLVNDTDVLGGYSSVADQTARDAIRTGVRQNGMIVYTQADGLYWQLGSDLTTWSQIFLGGGSAQLQTTGAITITVSGSGSDTPSVNRPAFITTGDYSAYPFQTIGAALKALPLTILHQVNVNVGAGTFQSPQRIPNFLGIGLEPESGAPIATLSINGTMANSTIASGDVTGTAGSGSTAFVVNKPTGAANWTADDLVGRYFVVTSGGGAAGSGQYSIGLIVANTTTTLTIGQGATMPIADNMETFLGVNSTTVFAIQDLETIIVNTLTNNPLVWCENVQAAILFSRLKFRSDADLTSQLNISNSGGQALCFCTFDANGYTVGGMLNLAFLSQLYLINCNFINNDVSTATSISMDTVNDLFMLGCLSVGAFYSMNIFSSNNGFVGGCVFDAGSQADSSCITMITSTVNFDNTVFRNANYAITSNGPGSLSVESGNSTSNLSQYALWIGSQMKVLTESTMTGTVGDIFCNNGQVKLTNSQLIAASVFNTGDCSVVIS